MHFHFYAVSAFVIYFYKYPLVFLKNFMTLYLTHRKHIEHVVHIVFFTIEINVIYFLYDLKKDPACRRQV